jgi:hypothetical protein
MAKVLRTGQVVQRGPATTTPATPTVDPNAFNLVQNPQAKFSLDGWEAINGATVERVTDTPVGLPPGATSALRMTFPVNEVNGVYPTVFFRTGLINVPENDIVQYNCSIYRPPQEGDLDGWDLPYYFMPIFTAYPVRISRIEAGTGFGWGNGWSLGPREDGYPPNDAWFGEGSYSTVSLAGEDTEICFGVSRGLSPYAGEVYVGNVHINIVPAGELTWSDRFDAKYAAVWDDWTDLEWELRIEEWDDSMYRDGDSPRWAWDGDPHASYSREVSPVLLPQRRSTMSRTSATVLRGEVE